MISPIKYLREVSQEINKVTWPTWQQTQQKTLLVVGASLGLALFVGAADLIFQRLIELIIK